MLCRPPVDGAVLLATDGSAVVRPEIEHGPAARLFVNGAPADLARIVLDPGRHELRVVEPGRPPHAIAIGVRQNSKERERMRSKVHLVDVTAPMSEVALSFGNDNGD